MTDYMLIEKYNNAATSWRHDANKVLLGKIMDTPFPELKVNQLRFLIHLAKNSNEENISHIADYIIKLDIEYIAMFLLVINILKGGEWLSHQLDIVTRIVPNCNAVLGY